jgi:hypothetical protein
MGGLAIRVVPGPPSPFLHREASDPRYARMPIWAWEPSREPSQTDPRTAPPVAALVASPDR